jgi:hypothetical protein
VFPWLSDQRGGYVKVCVVSIQQPRGPSVWVNDFFADVNVPQVRNTATKKPGSCPGFFGLIGLKSDR